MKIKLLFFLALILFASLFFKKVETSEIDCKDLRRIPIIGSLFVLSSKIHHEMQVSFFLSTNVNREPLEIGLNDWTALKNLELSKKTLILIHGYKSGGRKRWVLQLKDKLLDFKEANVILIDWSQGSYSKNYVTAAKNTEVVTNRLLQFLQSVRAQVEISNFTSNEVMWNHLHFIGHSLGAQISGQTAHLLREDNFWKIERITGLDPAKPCFKELESFLRLDKDDADFVDIIHTQVGSGGKTDGLGLKESIGHMDFYVNGGVVQPECTGSAFTPKWTTMICSHKLAYKYFAESVANAVHNGCKFTGYSWNGSSEDALQILSSKISDMPCEDCPEMGINAVKSNKRGKFLVIAAAREPHCQLTVEDVQSIIKVIERLKD